MVVLCPPDTLEYLRFPSIPLSPKTSSGSRTSAPSPRKLCRGYIFCGSWRSSTCQSQWWCTSYTSVVESVLPTSITHLPGTRADCSVSSVTCRNHHIAGELVSFGFIFVYGLCVSCLKVFALPLFFLCKLHFFSPPWGSGTNCDTIRFWPVPN